ncbi:uncharacterized protein Z519_00759 [Cladophialophora bantiana CBS 173.52]|uniref:Transcription factor domain-containing protein n=1 Tax=Cladophialophora bantiana (strain ATCC 10958 / CBS 173.52 / CDC B-1940 / NIH 8579) TaxID=1442370 RepID=A0A0D2FAH2_CLAB1|nr:uncharacterized protein Z519_00759 [Cladophialophora bantiana CBS 173.52]KIW99096.1 hypothetical protein Z519_00759 [Cladophialophora bantiana CBS 173.52]
MKTPSRNPKLAREWESCRATNFTNEGQESQVQNVELSSTQTDSSTSSFKHGNKDGALSPSNPDFWSSFDAFSSFDLSFDTTCASPLANIPPGQRTSSASEERIDGGSLPMSLTPSLEDQAMSFFFHNYVLKELATPYNHLVSLPTVSGPSSEIKVLSGMVISIGAAGISNLRNDPGLMHAAENIYSSTIQRLHTLLHDQNRIQKDQTMLLVLLLALYETVTCSTPQSIRTWSRHVRGATALLSIRGPDTLHPIAVQDVHMHLRLQIIIDCLQRRMSIPHIVADWAQPARAIADEYQPAQHQLDEISGRLCQLRCSIKDGLLGGNEAIRQAVSIDSELETWSVYTPITCAFNEVFDFEHPDDVFFGCYHVYSETRVALLWNNYRTLRMLTNEIILDTCYSSEIGSAWYQQRQRLVSEQLLKKLTADICASVPPLLGYPHGSSPARVMIGTLLLWPLYTCAAQNYASPKTREWAIIQFERIGGAMGIRLATLLGRALRARGNDTAWSVIDAEKRRKTVIQEIEENW